MQASLVTPHNISDLLHVGFLYLYLHASWPKANCFRYARPKTAIIDAIFPGPVPFVCSILGLARMDAEVLSE